MDQSSSGSLRVGVSALSRPRSLGRRVFLALVVLQLVLGIGSLAENLGDVPQYGDSYEYHLWAETLEVDAYRGFVYPAFLACVERLDDGSMAKTWRRLSREHGSAAHARAARGFVVLQLFQLGVFALSLAYFLRVLAADTPRTITRPLATGGSAVLFLLLLTDPLLAHFQLAVLSDGLALSASLVFCAALLACAQRRSLPRLGALALFLSALLAAGLRVEKTWILAGTALGTLALWQLEERRKARESLASPESRHPRALLATGIALAGVAAGLLLQQGLQGASWRWPVRDSILDQRVVFPHLAAEYDALSPQVRAELDRAQARRHDEDLRSAHEVIDEVTGGDAARRGALIDEAAAVVLREHGLALGLDVLADTLENVAATLSFYGRLGVLQFAGADAFARLFHSDGTQWTYTRMAEPHPRTTRLHVLSSGVFFLACALLTLAALRAPRRDAGAEIPRRASALWRPVGLFVLLNALAFALVADLVHVRYALFAHAVLLVLVFRGAAQWLDAEPRPSGAER